MAMPDDDLTERLLASLELAHDDYQRRTATAWLVLCYDEEAMAGHDRTGIVGCYGPFASPEETLIEKTKHDVASVEGFVNVIVPLYAPVPWRDEK
jgi:hypothetical protein